MSWAAPPAQFVAIIICLAMCLEELLIGRNQYLLPQHILCSTQQEVERAPVPPGGKKRVFALVTIMGFTLLRAFATITGEFKIKVCVVSTGVVWAKRKTRISSEIAQKDKRSRGIQGQQHWGTG